MTNRWKLTIEYDGTPYKGFQTQRSGTPTIQQSIEEAFFKFSGEIVRLHVAGRTDAGVHALAQVAHVDLNKNTSADQIQKAVNYFLKNEAITLLNVEEVDPDFHARFHALKRRYHYKIICNRPAHLTLDRGRFLHLKHDLNVEDMNKAAQHLVCGPIDFSSFRAADCQSSNPVKSIDWIRFDTKELKDKKGKLIVMTCEAPSFLHHQVRNIVGTLKLVGEGKLEPDEMINILHAKDRAKAGPTAPAHGLYFEKVYY